MSFALVVISNGRGELLRRTMRAIEQHVSPDLDATLICDDSGDVAYARWLRGSWPHARIDAHPHLGHGPAVSLAWRRARALPIEWVLWMEEDMVFASDIDLRTVASVIESAGIVQMVFRRDAHFPAERAAGPTQIDRFDPSSLTSERTHEWPWLRHRLFYSLNPHLVSRSFLAAHDWPPIPNSEHHFGLRLFRDRSVSVGLWGARGAAPIVLHIGTERTGGGY